MAKILSNTGIVTGLPVEAEHVSQSVNALTGVDAYDITISGSLVVNGLTYPYIDGPADLPILTDGAGNLTIRVLDTVPTASYVTASNVDGPHGFNSVLSSSYAISASHAIFAVLASSSLFAINAQQAENANTAISSSHTITASYALNGEDGKFSISSSHALTASYVQGNVTTPFKQNISGSSVNVEHKFDSDDILVGVYQSSGSIRPTVIIPSSIVLTDTNNVALTFSNVVEGYVIVTDGKGIANSMNIVSSSYALTASYAISSSHEVTNEISSSTAISASYALTASYALNAGSGGLTSGSIVTGSTIIDSTITSSTIIDSTITGSTIVDTIITSSTIVDTTITGSTITDTVITGSTIVDTVITSSTMIDSVISSSTITDTVISSSTLVEVIGSGSFSGSFVGDGSQLTGVTASLATTASYITSSNVDGPYGFDSIVSSSYAVTASHALNSNSISSSYALTASFLTGLVESASFATTASYIEMADAFRGDFTLATSVTVTHNIGSSDVLVAVYETTGGTTPQLIIPLSITLTNDFTAVIVFSTPVTGYVIITDGKGVASTGTAISSSYSLTSSYALTASHVIGGDRSYREAVTGTTAYTITHGLDEDFPIVQAYEQVTLAQEIPSGVVSTGVNSILVSFQNIFDGTIVVKK